VTISVGISAADTHDSQGLKPLAWYPADPLAARPASPPPEARCTATRATTTPSHAASCAAAGPPRASPRRGIKRSDPLGQHRRLVEHAAAWLNEAHRLHCRCERKATRSPAFVGLAATLICHRKLTK
jgi:hypothetical protein